MISPNKTLSVKKECSIPSIPPVNSVNMNTSLDGNDLKVLQPFSVQQQEIKDEAMPSCSSSSGSASTGATPSSTPSSSTAPSTSSAPSASSTSIIPGLPSSKCKTPIKFTAEELREKLMPTYDKLFKQEPEALPFHEPVNPILLQLPDYFDVIKRPMDLSTIKSKLDEGKYSNPQEYVDDVWLMLNNAWMYNKKTSKVYKFCTKLSEIFSSCIDPVMQSMGYCCGQQYTFSPQVLFCYGNQMCCTIPRDGTYYLYTNENQSLPNANCDKYTYCTKCFESIKADTVPIGDDPSQPLHETKKSLFVQMKNDHEEQEAFVECTECGRKWHQICALHMDQIFSKFTCETCIKNDKTGRLKQTVNRYTSSKLAQTRLGDFLESRVNNYLKTREHECSQRPGRVTIRILSAVDKICEIKPAMKQRYENELQHEQYAFKTKAIFAFEEIDGVDVVFFGMHVQEYGSECAVPNTRRVYISYLDSVFFFRPKEMRTAVYHELLIGYLDYVKRQGFQWAHIWACPPSEGDDYIFHCHPVEQKVPKPKRLQDWYKKMLDKGMLERTVIDYKDIHKDAIENGMKSPVDIPYFEGDFWPNVLEECIKEQEQEEEKRRKDAEAAAKSNDDYSQIYGTDDTMDGMDGQDNTSLACVNPANPNGKKKSNLSQKKKNIKSKMSTSQRKNTIKSKSSSSSTSDIMSKILSNMEKHKEVFFVIRLLDAKQVANMGPIIDPDPAISCELMNGRDEFLNFARERHHEFSSLRRAKYSSMALLYELHNQNNEKFIFKCNKCSSPIETMRYHCTVCDDFDLCIPCFDSKGGHEHKMDKLQCVASDKKESNSADNKLSNPAKPPKHSIETYLKAFMHAVYCRNANCTFLKCMQFKRVVQHSKNCQKFKNSQCEFCKQMIALCIYHAKNCKENMCQVPFCSTIKIKLKQQKAYNTTLERRRMQIMTRTFKINAAQQNNNNSTGASNSNEDGDESSNQPATQQQQQQQQQQMQQNIQQQIHQQQQQQQQQNMFNNNNNTMQFTNNNNNSINLTQNYNQMNSSNSNNNINNVSLLQQQSPNINLALQQQQQQQQQQTTLFMNQDQQHLIQNKNFGQGKILNNNPLQQQQAYGSTQPARPPSSTPNQISQSQQQQVGYGQMNDNNIWPQQQQRIVSNTIPLQQQQTQPGHIIQQPQQQQQVIINQNTVQAYVQKLRQMTQDDAKLMLMKLQKENPELFQRVLNGYRHHMQQQQQQLPPQTMNDNTPKNIIIINNNNSNNNNPQIQPVHQQQQQQQWSTINQQQQYSQQNPAYNVNTQQQMHNNNNNSSIRYPQQQQQQQQLGQPRQQILVNNSQQQILMQQQQQSRVSSISMTPLRHQNNASFQNIRPNYQIQQQQQLQNGYVNSMDNKDQMLPGPNNLLHQHPQGQQQQQQINPSDKLTQVADTL